MHRAIVVQKNVTYSSIELRVRYRRKSILDPPRKCFNVVIRRSDYNKPELFWHYHEAQKLKRGDEIYVDPFGEDWCDPIYNKKIRRLLNLKFF